jgi:PPOX class probable F420-dependent enzyme
VSNSIIPEKYSDLLTKRAFANLATIMPDGSPQVTPVWFETEGDLIVVNSARGRVKDRNMERDHRVALAIQDPENPYRYIQIRGVVAEITTEGADASIDRLAFKYMGVDKYPMRQPGEVRVMYKIKPESVTTM